MSSELRVTKIQSRGGGKTTASLAHLQEIGQELSKVSVQQPILIYMHPDTKEKLMKSKSYTFNRFKIVTSNNIPVGAIQTSMKEIKGDIHD